MLTDDAALSQCRCAAMRLKMRGKVFYLLVSVDTVVFACPRRYDDGQQKEERKILMVRILRWDCVIDI